MLTMYFFSILSYNLGFTVGGAVRSIRGNSSVLILLVNNRGRVRDEAEGSQTKDIDKVRG